MCKCKGCGVKLQDNDEKNIGYTKNINNELCERCFRIRNYNDYKLVIKDNNDYINILKNINQNDLVILVIDLFNIKNIEEISKYIKNKILLVLTKRDILPKSCYDEKLLKYFDNYNLNIVDKVIISSKKNYNFDLLFDKINKHKTSNNVYVIGFTNSGKSTMINKIIYNYSSISTQITTSNLPSTTIDSISVKINDTLTLIDTPGLLDNGDIINYIDSNTLKKIIPNTEIKPITYQVKNKQIISIDELFEISLSNNNITIYASNNLKINRYYKKQKTSNLIKKEFIVDKDTDIVISGLCFIKFTKKEKIEIYTLDNVEVNKRKSLI